MQFIMILITKAYHTFLGFSWHILFAVINITFRVIVRLWHQQDHLFAVLQLINVNMIIIIMFGVILPDYRQSCNVSYVADRCTTLPYFDHAVLGEGVNGLFSSSARFLCRPGYRFPDGSTLKSISCQKNLEWELIDDCIGDTSFYFYRSCMYSTSTKHT